LESFSDVAQNIMSATYNWTGGWWAQVNLQTQWDQLCAKEAGDPQTILQGKAGHLITVMDDWEQLNTNATLLKLAKHCHSLFRVL